MTKILLVEPEFPIPPKSKNHAHFLPVGLLKIGSYHKQLGDTVQLVRGNLPKNEILFTPDVIMVTSLFTYWSKYVTDTVKHYRRLFPSAYIMVGGIFASLMPDKCKEIIIVKDQFGLDNFVFDAVFPSETWLNFPDATE